MKISPRATLGASAVALTASAFGLAPTSAMNAAESSAIPAVAALPAVYQHPGRILAGNCFQCHGTNGVNGPWDKLIGMTSDELYKKLKELQRSNESDSAIMKVHAMSYTDDQLRLIADYFAHMPATGSGG